MGALGPDRTPAFASLQPGETVMNSIFYIIGVVVVALAVISLVA